MKPSRHLVVLVLSMAFLALAITLATTKSAQAAQSGQSVEERIKATLEDANEALGGGFKWTSENSGEYIMDRPPKKIGNMSYGEPVFLSERMIIGFADRYDTCESSYNNSSTFHGMQACLHRKPHYLNQGYFIGLSWQPQDGLENNGTRLYFYVVSGLDPTCAGYDADTEASCGDWSKSTKPLILAEALHQAAIKNGLYEPLEEEILPVTPEEIQPIDPVEEVPNQPVVPADPSTSTDEGGLFGIPIPIILGSLGIPVAGAVVGSIVSSLTSLLGSNPIPGNVNPAVVPASDQVNDQGLYWSERPWDKGGPGYVPKEEYERTKSFMDQGYKWTNGGWQAPDQIQESNQWQQNNRDAVDREEAEWQAKRDVEQQALEQNEADLKKTADELQEAGNMIDLKDGLETINQDLQEKNIYVFNPYQGDPTLIAHGLVMTKNFVWDKSVGLVTGSNGLTCEGFVDQTYEGVKTIVHDRYGPGAKVESMKFAEKSTIDPRKEWLDPGKYKDFLDRIIDDNHNLIKVTLPDGSQWAVDFHQHNTGNKPPILRPWAEVEQEWKTYLGEHEFIQYSSKSG